MFEAISWLQYLLFILFSLTIYYAYVVVKFYTRDIKSILSGITKRLSTSLTTNEMLLESESEIALNGIQQELFPGGNSYQSSFAEKDDTLQKIEGLTGSLKTIIEEASTKKIRKEEFILSLQVLLQNYQYLKGSPFVVAIDNFIASECERYRFIKLNAEERVLLWNEQ